MLVLYFLGIACLLVHVDCLVGCQKGKVDFESQNGDTKERFVIFSDTNDDTASLDPNRYAITKMQRKFLNNMYQLRARVKNFMRQKDGEHQEMYMSLEVPSDTTEDSTMLKARIKQSASFAHSNPSEAMLSVAHTGVNRMSQYGDVAFYGIQIFGLIQTIEALYATGPDGAPTFEYLSVTGILTLLSVPGQLYGIVAEPILVAHTFNGIYRRLKTVSRKDISSILRMCRFGKLKDVAATLVGKAKLGGLSIARSKGITAILNSFKVTGKATMITRISTAVAKLGARLIAPIVFIDVLLSTAQLADAIKAFRANKDPAYQEYYEYSVAMASVGAGLSYISAVLTAILIMSIDPASKAIAAIGLFVCGIVSVVFMIYDSSEEQRLKAQRSSRRMQFAQTERSSCRWMAITFFRYLVKVAQEMDYLAANSSYVQNSSTFNLRQLSRGSEITEPYFNFAKIVIEEKRVIPTLSPLFLKQLRHKELPEIRNRSVSVESVVLPSNVFLGVSSHSCAKSAGTGQCDSANVHRVVIMRVAFIGNIDIRGAFDDSANGPPDPYCRFEIHGHPVAWLRTRANTRRPVWDNLNVYLDLARVGDKMESFGFECMDEDIVGNYDDYLGYQEVVLNATGRKMVSRNFGYGGGEPLIANADIEFTYEVFGLHKTPSEWIGVPLSALNSCDLTAELRESYAISFIGCQLECENHHKCNARTYRSSSRECGLYWCDEVDPDLELKDVQGQQEIAIEAYAQLRSVNCGGSYARSCDTCDRCFGQCKMNKTQTCVERTCGRCVFPFIEGSVTYWGCTSAPKSYRSKFRCATKVDANWNAISTESCDMSDSQCKQLCGTYICSVGWSQTLEVTECEGECTDERCRCGETSRRSTRGAAIDRAILYGAPHDTTDSTLDHWIAAGKKMLFLDESCIGDFESVSHDITRSRVYLAEPGYSDVRKLEVAINKDSIELHTVNTIILDDHASFSELPSVHVHYDIKMNGCNNTQETYPNGIGGMSLNPLRYTLIVPSFDFGPDTPTDRSGSFSYTLHKTSVRDTIVTLEVPTGEYGRYSWRGRHGILQSCIQPYARPLHQIRRKWHKRLMSIYPARIALRYRTVDMGSVVNDRIAFVVRSEMNQCQINHIRKTFMLEAIVAKLHQRFTVHFYLEQILDTLEEYRNVSEVFGFQREERLVQVLLTKAPTVTFYFNGASGWRPWTLFVPRIVEKDGSMDFQIAGLEDTLFHSQIMHSYNILAEMINATYIFPSLGYPFFVASSALVTILLPFTENPKVVKVVCPICTLNEVKDALVAALRGTDMIVDYTELRIVHTHHNFYGAVSPREKPLTLYTTPEMRDGRYFPHDAQQLLALGYFETIDGSGCVMARTLETSGKMRLFRALPVSYGSAPKKVAQLKIPNRIVADKTIDSGSFQDLYKSKIPACDGIIAIIEDYTKFCVTCSVASILEFHNYDSKMKDYDWERDTSAFLFGAEDTFGAARKGSKTPILHFFPSKKVPQSGVGFLRYQQWKFRLPHNLIEDSGMVSKQQIPPSADSSRPRRYFFAGVVRHPPGASLRIFALWLPIRSEDDPVICDHRRDFLKKCKMAREDFEDISSIDEMRIVEDGFGTFVLRTATMDLPYEFTVDRLIVDNITRFVGQRRHVLTRTQAMLIQQRGTSRYAYGGCEFVSNSSVTLLSKEVGRSPICYLLDENDVVMKLQNNCKLSATNMRLGALMKSHGWISDAVHLDIALDDENNKLPRVPGYSIFSFSFNTTLRNISVHMGQSWMNGVAYVSLFVSETISSVEVRTPVGTIIPSKEPTQIADNEHVTIQLVQVPCAIDEDDKRRDANIERVSIFARYSAYNLTSRSQEERHNCGFSCGEKLCLPNGICARRGAFFSELTPGWRRRPMSAAISPELYCYKDTHFQAKRCANLRDFYLFAVRTLFNGTTLDTLDTGTVLGSSFGKITFCDTDLCAANAASNTLSGYWFNHLASTFVLKLVKANALSARIALWPDYERSSGRGFAGVALMEISLIGETEQCDRMSSIPTYATDLAKSDPDGFGRLLEQVYFEAVLDSALSHGNLLCVRVSSAYASLATKEYQTVADSSDHLAAMVRSKSTFKQSLLSSAFVPSGETLVDMRVSSVYTIIESLITFLHVAKVQKWNWMAIMQQDLLWSLFKDQDFLYFERFGGITVRNWPKSGAPETGKPSWFAKLAPNLPIIGPLLRRMLRLLRIARGNGKQNPGTASGKLHTWHEIVKGDFEHGNSMKLSIDYLKKLKSDFPNIENCTTPIDPAVSAHRYLYGKYLGESRSDLHKVHQTAVSHFRLATPQDTSDDEGVRIDDSCYAYVVTILICLDGAAITFDARYNGIDWDPVIGPPKKQGYPCSAPGISSLPGPVLWQSMKTLRAVANAARGPAYRPNLVRVRIKNADSLCAMYETQSPHIRAVQRYLLFPDWYSEGYVGISDSRYRLRFDIVMNSWGLTYRASYLDTMVVLMHWKGTRVTEMREKSSDQFIVEDPFYAEPFDADPVIDKNCVSHINLPREAVSYMEYYRIIEQPPIICESIETAHQPDVLTGAGKCCRRSGNEKTCETFEVMTKAHTCDDTHSLLLERHFSSAHFGECLAECEKRDSCKYATQYSNSTWCQLWATCSTIRAVSDGGATISRKPTGLSFIHVVRTYTRECQRIEKATRKHDVIRCVRACKRRKTCHGVSTGTCISCNCHRKVKCFSGHQILDLTAKSVLIDST